MVWVQTRPKILSVLTRVQTVCKGYQQPTKITTSGERNNDYLYWHVIRDTGANLKFAIFKFKIVCIASALMKPIPHILP